MAVPKPFVPHYQRKLVADKIWRLNHCYLIKNRSARFITFRENPAQVHYRQNRHTRNIILKSRRIGFTTFECVDMLDDTLWKPIDALIIAHTEDDAAKIFDNTVALAWEHYPFKDWYKIDTQRANRLKFGWGTHPVTKAQKYSSISVSNSGRSGNFNRVLISEFGKICAKFPDRAKEIISGTIPTIPLDGMLTIESTAEGSTGYYHDMFWEAYNRPQSQILRPTDLKAHFYNWTWDEEEIAKVGKPYDPRELPEYFQKYQKVNNLTDIQISFYFIKWESLAKDFSLLKQEYPTTPIEAFESSGNTLFQIEKIIYQQNNFKKEPRLQGDWRIYDEPNPKHVYAIGGDPSEGTGSDHAAAVIIDFSTSKPRIVATFKNQYTTPDMLAYEMANMGKIYNGALLAPERNNHGHATIQKLKDIYPHHLIFKEIRTDKTSNEQTEKLGFNTNSSTKPTMVFDFNAALNDDQIEIPDPTLLTEMRTYPRDDVSAIRSIKEQTVHWDLLMAAMIAYQMRKYLDFATQTRTYIVSNGNILYNSNTVEKIPSSLQPTSQPFDPFSPI